MRDAKLANQFKNEHPTSCFNARPFSKEISKERGFIKSLPGHSRLAITISLDSVALRIDLALLSGISNTEKTGSFSSNFPLELGFRDRRKFLGRVSLYVGFSVQQFQKTFIRTLWSLSWFASLCGRSWISARRSFWDARFSQFLQNFVDTLGKATCTWEIVDMYSRDGGLPRMWI